MGPLASMPRVTRDLEEELERDRIGKMGSELYSGGLPPMWSEAERWERHLAPRRAVPHVP
eukprot:5441195-Amphidinium_carterae.1